MPFVSGHKAVTSDYEPAPHGFPGFTAPVEKIYPCMVPFLELEDGRTVAAVDGADEIKPAADGKSVTAVWGRWGVTRTKTRRAVDSGLVFQATRSLPINSISPAESAHGSKP